MRYKNVKIVTIDLGVSYLLLILVLYLKSITLNTSELNKIGNINSITNTTRYFVTVNAKVPRYLTFTETRRFKLNWTDEGGYPHQLLKKHNFTPFIKSVSIATC